MRGFFAHCIVTLSNVESRGDPPGRLDGSPLLPSGRPLPGKGPAPSDLSNRTTASSVVRHTPPNTVEWDAIAQPGGPRPAWPLSQPLPWSRRPQRVFTHPGLRLDAVTVVLLGGGNQLAYI
jgi:hypothetical protein